MLRIALLISILALFGDCMDMGKRKLGGISINEPSEYGTKEKEAIATKENAQTSKDPPTSAGGQNEAIPSPKKPSPKGKLKSDFGLNLAKAFPRPVPKGRRGKEKVGEKISVMNTAERIEKMDIAQDKAKMEIDNIDTNAKPKQNEDKGVMNTAERIEKMDLAQDKAKMDIDTNGKPKQNEENAPPKYVFIWSGNNEKKNLEVDLRVIRHSKKLSELFHAKSDQSVNAKHGKQEALPVPKQEAEKILKEVEEWYAHHKNDKHKNAPVFVFKCKDNVSLVINVHLDAVRLSKELSNMLEDTADEGYPKPIPSPVPNFKSDIMLKLIKLCEEYKYKFDGLKKITDVPTGEVAEASASNVQEGEVGEASASKVKAGTIAEEIQKFVPPPHIMQWDVKTDLEMVRAADFYNINRLINDDYIDNVYEIVKVKWINGKTPQEIRKAFGVEEPYPSGHPEWARVEKENEWEESDEEREARHAKEREEEEERERKEEQKRKEKEAERLHQEQLQQQQDQNQEQEHQLGQEHDEELEHDEVMHDVEEEQDDEWRGRR